MAPCGLCDGSACDAAGRDAAAAVRLLLQLRRGGRVAPGPQPGPTTNDRLAARVLSDESSALDRRMGCAGASNVFNEKL
ncbi:unnamed protein product [Lampetra fluviatilis]